MSVDACKRPVRPQSTVSAQNLTFVDAPNIAPEAQLGGNVVLTSKVALSSPGSTCIAPFVLRLPVEAGVGASNTTT